MAGLDRLGEIGFIADLDFPGNGAANLPVPLAAFCDIAELRPLHQCQQVAERWLLGTAIKVCFTQQRRFAVLRL